MNVLTAFQRSRIYAQGWNAARTGATRKDATNPHTSEPEKSRWDEGYANATRSNRQQQIHFMASQTVTDPAAK